MPNKAITLVELMIAVALMGVVILGAVSFDAASRKMVGSSERRAVVMNDLAYILDAIDKDVELASGTVIQYNAGGSCSGPAGPNGVQVCRPIDINTDGASDCEDPTYLVMSRDTAGTPTNVMDDTMVDYRYWDAAPCEPGEEGTPDNYIARNGVYLSQRVVDIDMHIVGGCTWSSIILRCVMTLLCGFAGTNRK